ncbi:MAG: hypothetical protein US50_C0064G0008 [Candidatus Nomurabacteria bacterium GW2011_GWB1_37_5]|uniref:Uncharacterized protein n=1 Tax=Candidatus Nomurabacteria bacterium GW2011_GWB1_37_5 TaxID=1618742 RepID=A0A0G0K076_9BACT|nr:MAG: hypothetical protein US50_C0064G0008 [Candidatus Nomurabacteria bacterium GW2011_GWB1_37_5]
MLRPAGSQHVTTIAFIICFDSIWLKSILTLKTENYGNNSFKSKSFRTGIYQKN